MKLSDMTDAEKHALGTLVRRMVGADGATSVEETAGLQQAADGLGAEEFWGLVMGNEESLLNRLAEIWGIDTAGPPAATTAQTGD